jgi:DNA repair protein RecN (Recombination protein N)
MLLELTIHNFAVIQETRLTPGPGLNVVTGETGAGKSLLIDALEMVMGGQPDRDNVRTDTPSASVEAVFHLSSEHFIWRLLADRCGLEPERDGLLVLSRETQREGRTLSRLNGRTVPASLVREVGRLLVDIHGQGSHISLMDPAFQLTLLDSFGGLDSIRAEVTAAVTEVRRLEAELASYTTDAKEREQRSDLLAFQRDEIDTAALRPSEEESLMQERELLSNAGAIREACAAAQDALFNGTPNAVDLLANARRFLEHAPDPLDALKQQTSALESASVQVEEATRALRTYADAIDDDPDQLEAVEERLQLVRRLVRKYGNTIEAVLAHAEDSRRELEVAEHTDEQFATLEQAQAEASARVAQLAWDLSAQRNSAATALTLAVTAELDSLALGNIRFHADLRQQATPNGIPGPGQERYAFSETGVDHVEFQVATNPGEGLKPLAKAASGGETSRFMLAITGALAAHGAALTLVFDEIDSGVGGRTGETVGRKLRSLSRHGQVLCVTHLPQIAAFADHHFRVDKQVIQGRTFAHAALLEDDERVPELAVMLGGPPGPELESAAQLLLAQATKADESLTSTTQSKVT